MPPAIHFQEQEAGYRTWLTGYPEGWVVNTNRPPNSNYLRLHRASCHTISEYRQHEGKEAFTGGRYSKVCGTHPGALLAWIKERGFNGFTGYCTACKTSEDSLSAASGLSTLFTQESPPETPGEDDVWREGQIRARRGQTKFRAKLLKAYSHQCALTGTKLDLLLEAAHIVPHSSGTDYRLSNGILLRADIHTLFDLHHLSIDAEGQVHLSKLARQTEYEGYHGVMVHAPLAEADRPAPKNLAQRHARFVKIEQAREQGAGC